MTRLAEEPSARLMCRIKEKIKILSNRRGFLKTRIDYARFQRREPAYMDTLEHSALDTAIWLMEREREKASK